MSKIDLTFIRREDRTFEQVVFAEVLVPDVLNTFNDYSTKEQVKAMAYEFARQGYGLDVDHDGIDVRNLKYYVVESFIARPGDTDFIEGSWVVGVKVVDPDLWQRILDGTINGFSYEADVFYTPGVFESPGIRTITGVTEPDPFDGHTHEFTVLVGADNQVISGGTGMIDGHYHPITSHTVTDKGDGHTHKYQIVEEA